MRVNQRVDDKTIRDILQRTDNLDHAPFAVGIAILPFRLVGVIADLNGTKLGVQRWDLPHMDVTRVVERVAALTRYLVGMSLGFDLPHPRIRVGLQIGGPVDSANGVVRFYCNHQIEAEKPRPEETYEWSDVPLGELVQEAVGCPTVVDNDANAFAAYELKFGGDLDTSSFVLVFLNDGVGAGVALDHKLLAAPIEFGHLQVWEDGRHCECGNAGCVDAHAGRRAISAIVRDLTHRGGIASVEQAAEIADRGDDDAAKALSAFTKAGESVARGLATMLTLFGPRDVVLYGPEALLRPPHASVAADHFLAGVSKFTDHAYPVVRDSRLVLRPLPRNPDSDRGAHGAALIALHRHFYAPLGQKLEYGA